MKLADVFDFIHESPKGSEVDVAFDNGLTAFEDMKVEEIQEFIDSYGLDSLADGSMAGIIYKLTRKIDELRDGQPEQELVSVGGPVKKYLLSDENDDFTKDEFDKLRHAALTAMIDNEPTTGGGIVFRCIARNDSGKFILKGYDRTLLRLIGKIERLEKELYDLKKPAPRVQVVKPEVLPPASPDVLSQAATLHAAYQRGMPYPGVVIPFESLTSEQREAWIRIALAVNNG